MTGNDREYLRPPEEFPPPGAQTTPPPPEFGSGGTDAPSLKRSKKKYHWLAGALAAGLLSTVALFSGSERVILEPVASSTPTAAVIAGALTPPPTLDHTPSPSPVPAGVPTPAPTATAAPTAAPEPVPGVQLTFYRTSEVYHGMVTLKARDKMEAVTVRLWDRTLQETMWEQGLTADEIGTGLYRLPDFDLGASEFARNHWDQLMAGYEPDPILEVTCTVRADNGVETFTEHAEAAYELMVSARYDLKNPEEDFLHSFAEQTTYPDCFVVRIEETPYGEVNLFYGENVELQPGDVSVIIRAGGQMLPGDGWHVQKNETVYPEGTLYAYALVIPRPGWMPEHGEVEISIARQLIHYPDKTVTDIKTVEY